MLEMSGRAKNWLEEAKWDFQNALILMDNNRFNTVVFLCHQAAEKAMKALLYQHNLNGWGHSIYSLLYKYQEIKGSKYDQIIQDALSLDKHYITTRYPDALPDLAPHNAYSKSEAELAIKQAERIIQFIEREMRQNE